MEKISRIVPGSSRVTAVDMKNEKPVRASAPSYGQPVSDSVSRGPVKHAVDGAGRAFNEVYGADAKVNREAEIARRLTDDFFANQGRHHPAVADEPLNVQGPGERVTVPEVELDDSVDDGVEMSAPSKSSSNPSMKGSFSVVA